MATKLYWFSGTGNSLAVAKAIAAGLDDAELVPIARAVGAPGEPAERIGLIFPVYAFGPPLIVERFVRSMPAADGAEVFAVITYAGASGGTVKLLRRLLAERGLGLSAAYGVKMPSNYPPMGGAPKEAKQQKVLAKAARRIEAIVADVRAGARGTFANGFFLFRWMSGPIHRGFAKGVPTADRKFTADDRCNECGLCAQVCPVGNIEMVDGRPQWLGHCEQCFACFHLCPQRAIQCGKKTDRQARYHHPDTTAADFIVRAGAGNETEEPDA